MKKQVLDSKIAFIVAEKGFKTVTVTTGFTNKYLLGGKDFLITEMCIYLWMCELQKWLREEHNISIYLEPFWETLEDCKDRNKRPEFAPWVIGEYIEESEEPKYYKDYNEALLEGLKEALTLIE